MMFMLSIHERYIRRMFSGEKLFEYRKRIPSRLKRGDSLAIYCTKPTCRIVAYAEIGGVLEDVPKKLWKKTRFAAGIGEQSYMDYFKGKSKAYGIIIKKVYPLPNPISLASLIGKCFAPQSFIYLTDEQAEKVMSHAVHAKEQGVSIFVGGVHGVGKTTICNTTLNPLGFNCISASELIRRQLALHMTDKRVRNVCKNQKVLVTESNKEKSKSLLYCLDGHYCLLNKNGDIEQLPVEVFDALGFDILTLVDSTADMVVKHLEARDGNKWSKKAVSALMRAERTHAKRVSQELGIPLVVINARTNDCSDVIESSLVEVLSKRRTVDCYDDPRL